MTNPFTPVNQSTDRLEIVKRNNQLMIVKVWDYPEHVRTPHNKDGMVYPKDGEPFPNRAIRAAVVDLGDMGADGQPGKLYAETWFHAFSMMRTMKGWVGQLKLITWLQDQEPRDPHGNPKQTNPYAITDHFGNPEAIALAQDYLTRHPEFLDLPAPAPYDGRPPAPPQPQYQAPPQPWNSQQPPQAPQGAPGSFFQAAAGQPGPPQPPQQYLPGQPNHHGFPQDQLPPF